MLINATYQNIIGLYSPPFEKHFILHAIHLPQSPLIIKLLLITKVCLHTQYPSYPYTRPGQLGEIIKQVRNFTRFV